MNFQHPHAIKTKRSFLSLDKGTAPQMSADMPPTEVLRKMCFWKCVGAHHCLENYLVLPGHWCSARLSADPLVLFLFFIFPIFFLDYHIPNNYSCVIDLLYYHVF